MRSEDVLGVLSIKEQTLYAYVSRGLVRTMRDPAEARRSLYARHDFEALAARRRRPRGRAAVAEGAVDWGEPVLDSAISTVRDGALYFGGRLATELSADFSLEEVASHHWRCSPAPAVAPASLAAPSAPTALARGLRCLADMAALSPPILGRTRGALAAEGLGLLFQFAGALMGAPSPGPVHQRLQRAWGVRDDAADAVRRALVLMSDHELNASTFAVRVAASTGASLPASALAGLATLTGPLHGGAAARSLSLLAEVMADETALGPALAARANGPPMAFGFGHPLYPNGDPRAVAILQALPSGAEARRCVQAVEQVVGQPPNCDAALAALALTYGLPAEAPFVIFAAGRMVGWIAHAIEQTESGRLIRPRARYTGPPFA